MNTTADAFNSALVHSLWQDTVVGLLLWGALVVLRHSSANARYVVSCAALALMAALPVVTTIVLSERGVSGASSTPALIIAASLADDTLRPTVTPAADEARPLGWVASLKPWMLPIWLAGVMACSLRLVMAGLHTVALRRRSDPEEGPIAAMVATLAARIGVGRPVSVRISTMTDGPATLGFLRPVILLPPAVALGVTPQQLEALLAHELAHIRRHDYLVNVLQMLAETLFFYHPAVWWASRRIRIERELCCDDIAVNACGDAVGYAQALTRVARLQFAPPGMTVGATGGAFLQRIHRLLGVASTTRPASPLWIAAASVVLIVAVMFTGPYAQSQSPGTLAAVSTNDETVLRGRVVDASSGQPVPRATVRAQYITGVENPLKCPIGDCEDVEDGVGRIPTYRATTGSDGRFDIPGVTPGDYLVAAAASGYVQRYYGQTSNDMPEMSVHVTVGQAAPSIDVRLEPAGAVMGHVFSDRGEGLSGVEVELLRSTYVPGGAQPIPVAFAQTEERGAFTFRNVTAGEYYVRAYAEEPTRPRRGDTSLSYVATLFPNATDITFAQPIVVDSGQELPGVDFALVTARTRVVSGRLIDPGGASVSTATVRLMPRRVANGILNAPATANGNFRFASVPAGEYMLVVFDTSSERSWNTAYRDLAIFEDVTDLELFAGPRVSIDGRIARENGQPLPFDSSELQIFTEQRSSKLGTHSAGFAKAGTDGTFAIESGTGTMAVRIVGLPPRWFVKTMQLDGIDITDRVFELGPAAAGRRLDITLTDRVGKLVGTVTDDKARPVPNALIVIFPEDRSRWDTPRSVRTTFSHQQGRFELEALPISSYRAVAVTSLPRDAWTDPAVLSRLVPSSSSVSMDDVGLGTVRLRVVPPPMDLIQ